MVDNLTKREEDYLRGILEVLKEKGFARIRDIAIKVSVAPPSAVEMMKKLDGKGLVVYEKYGGVTLTGQGRELAMIVSQRHETFRKLLEILQLPKGIVNRDAHILEHQLDPKTILQFKRFVDFITSSKERPRFVGRWMEMFKKFSEESDKNEL
jgi:DtxR family Mn-dependent transcriptional regulator